VRCGGCECCGGGGGGVGGALCTPCRTPMKVGALTPGLAMLCAFTYPRTHARTHTRARTRTHTHTHTHARTDRCGRCPPVRCWAAPRPCCHAALLTRCCLWRTGASTWRR
jgi:hypothetical protein